MSRRGGIFSHLDRFALFPSIEAIDDASDRFLGWRDSVVLATNCATSAGFDDARARDLSNRQYVIS